MIMIYLMGISDVFFAICCRGLSKTFIVGLGNIVKMNLYPYTEAVITSSTVAQANKMVEDKIRDELIKKLSPYLLYMYEHEYLVITKPEDGYRIENKLNGSTLRVLPCQDSSRGPRATILTYEEARLLKKAWLIPYLRRWRIQDKPNILVILYMVIILVGKRNVNISISHLLDISLSGSGYCSKRRSLVYLQIPK